MPCFVLSGAVRSPRVSLDGPVREKKRETNEVERSWRPTGAGQIVEIPCRRGRRRERDGDVVKWAGLENASGKDGKASEMGC